MPLCSDEIYWGEIRATNLPPRHHTTTTQPTRGFDPCKLTTKVLLPSGSPALVLELAADPTSGRNSRLRSHFQPSNIAPIKSELI